MKKITFSLLILVVLFSACENSQKLLNTGNYDAAINLSARKLSKNKTNQKEILVLEQAYKKDLESDRARIDFLKQEGRPENWDEIYSIYEHITNKQNMIRPLIPLTLTSQNRDANFEFIDVNAELIASKQKASEYDFAAAMQLLDKGDKTNARNAFLKLQHVKSIYPVYKDIDDQLNRAHAMGMSFALYKMQNQSGMLLPADFENELTKISLNELNGMWIQYDTRAVDNRNYDYYILVNMKVIEVSPEEAKENTFIESRDIDDGFQYVLDGNGNVKKDPNGNDMKVPKTKTISCAVTELHQFKKAAIVGSLDYVDNASQQLLKSFPVASENVFANNAAKSDGDVNALKPETKAKLGSGPLPFPPSPAMILNAGQTLKAKVKDIIWANKTLLY